MSEHKPHCLHSRFGDDDWNDRARENYQTAHDGDPPCTCDQEPAPARRAPVQGEKTLKREPGYKPPGTIDWWEHLLAWDAYAKRYGDEQSAERIAERGGFSWLELIDLLGHEPITWEPRS